MIDDEDVLIYMMNELVETEKMVNIFKVMMEYEDYPFDFLMDQFLSIIERLDAYSMTTVPRSFLMLWLNLTSARSMLFREKFRN